MKAFYLVAGMALMAPIAGQADPITPEQLANARCFEFDAQTPQRDFHFQRQTVTGCYLKISEDKEIAFLKDSEGANKFTTAMTTLAGDNLELRHFSQTQGKTTKAIQKDYVINPLPIPATLEEALSKNGESIRELNELSVYSDALRNQLNEIHDSFYDKSYETSVIDEDFGILPEEGFLAESSYLPTSRQPADGYWWPHTGVPLANGPSSPLAKYDKYVESVTGKNPNSYEWERNHHYTDTFWAGHCNGWVASSILYGFDGVDLVDRRNGMTITASDLQGLRTATSYCVSNKVIGRRYRGAGSDVNDIHPDKFHKNLVYYIRNMKKPMALDYLSMLPVDNHIVSGYSFTYERAGNRRYLVTAKLRMHEYNYTKVNVKQVARPYELVYKYYLWKDSRGRPVGGRWVDPKNHPDFMWVPLSQSKCRGENPRMDHKMVEHMLKNLRRTSPRY